MDIKMYHEHLLPSILLDTHCYYYLQQTYLLLTGRLLFSDSYVASPIQTATETLGKLKSLLTESGKIPEKDISATASFLRLCLAIRLSKRASTAEIVNGSWIMNGCSCRWCG